MSNISYRERFTKCFSLASSKIRKSVCLPVSHNLQGKNGSETVLHDCHGDRNLLTAIWSTTTWTLWSGKIEQITKFGKFTKFAKFAKMFCNSAESEFRLWSALHFQTLQFEESHRKQYVTRSGGHIQRIAWWYPVGTHVLNEDFIAIESIGTPMRTLHMKFTGSLSCPYCMTAPWAC